MRPAVSKILGAVFVVAMAAAFATTYAQFNDPCILACLAQFDADRAACEADFQAALNQIASETQACLDAAGGDPIASFFCIREGRIKTINAEFDFRLCIAGANTALNDCVRACAASPSAP